MLLNFLYWRRQRSDLTPILSPKRLHRLGGPPGDVGINFAEKII